MFNDKNQSLCEEVDLNPDKTDSPSGDLLQNLIEKLQLYKVELLTNVGERYKYKSLCRECINNSHRDGFGSGKKLHALR